MRVSLVAGYSHHWPAGTIEPARETKSSMVSRARGTTGGLPPVSGTYDFFMVSLGDNLIAVITTKFNNFARLISFHLVLQARDARRENFTVDQHQCSLVLDVFEQGNTLPQQNRIDE